MKGAAAFCRFRGLQLWLPNQPRSRYWRRHEGPGLRKRMRCPSCERGLLVVLAARGELDGHGLAFLARVPLHRTLVPRA